MAFATLYGMGFIGREDSSLLTEQMVDPTLRKEIEGGFVVTRRRFTRRVKMITTGFTDISQADKLLWESFLETIGGGSVAFTYTYPITGVSVSVRLKEIPEIKYVGMGTNYRWDIKPIKMETT